MKIVYLFVLILSPFFLWLQTAAAQLVSLHFSEGGYVKLYFSPQQINNKTTTIQGVMTLNLKPGWKTYWRNPGNSGVAPNLILDQEKAYGEIFFPPPFLFQQHDEWNFGYKNQVSLPFHIRISPFFAQNTLSGTFVIGICKRLCLVEQLSFSLSLHEKALPFSQEKITAALQKLPQAARDDFKITKLDFKKDHLSVTLRHPATIKIPELFLDGGDVELGIATALTPELRTAATIETDYFVPTFSSTINLDTKIIYTARIDNDAIEGTSVIMTETK